MNTRQIARAEYVGAFVVGCAISSVWWWNARTASKIEEPFAWVAYALGAGVGTVIGMFLGGLT